MTVATDFNKLLKYVRHSLRYRVRMRDFDRENIIGCVYRKLRLVGLSNGIRNNDRKMLHTLLHEAGHILSFNYECHPAWSSEYRRPDGKIVRARSNKAHIDSETQAYLLGSSLAVKLGIKLNKRAWRAFNWQSRL